VAARRMKRLSFEVWMAGDCNCPSDRSPTVTGRSCSPRDADRRTS
jgi:hypothetical protein